MIQHVAAKLYHSLDKDRNLFDFGIKICISFEHEATCILAMTVHCLHAFFAQCITQQLLQFQWLLKVCLLLFISEHHFISMINLTRN